MPPVVAAALVVLFEGLVLWAVFPIMSYYCADLGGGPAAVGILFALMSGPRVLFNPIFGRLSERFGRRPLMVVASLGTMAGSIAWAVSPNVGWLAVSRAIAGIFGAQAALSSAVVADVTSPDRRSSGMGLVGAAFGLSMVFGPLLGGWVTGKKNEYVARTLAEYSSLKDLAQVMVAKDATGHPVFLADVARIEDAHALQRVKTVFGGQECIKLAVFKQTAANTVEVAGAIRQHMAELKGTLPPDVKTEVIYDSSDYVRRSVASVRDAVIIAAILVLLVTAFFLTGW